MPRLGSKKPTLRKRPPSNATGVNRWLRNVKGQPGLTRAEAEVLRQAIERAERGL